jgi:hypothetical protein
MTFQVAVAPVARNEAGIAADGIMNPGKIVLPA